MPMEAALGAGDEEGRQAHDEDGDEEGVLAADDVADAAEHDRAERTHEEAGGESEQREDVTRRRRIGAEELRADDGRERPVEVEVVPLEHVPSDEATMTKRSSFVIPALSRQWLLSMTWALS